MIISTKNTLFGKLFDSLGINKSFHKYEPIDIDSEASVISPVEARVAHIGEINQEGIITSKNNRIVNLRDLIGNYANHFSEGTYINFYLSPLNKHFWVTPCNGQFVYTQKNEGKSFFSAFVGLENMFGIEMFSKAVKKNASISSVLQAKDFMVAMIAVGSINVNRIHVDYEEKKQYNAGVPCGYFSLGSSMLLCFPTSQEFLVKEGAPVKIGERIVK